MSANEAAHPPPLGLIVVATLASCGGFDSEDGSSRRAATSSADARLASDRFVRRIDAMCKDATPDLAEISTALTQARDAGRAGRASLPKTFKTFAMLLRRAHVTTARFEARLAPVTVAVRPARSSQSSCSATLLGWSYSGLSGVIASAGLSGRTTSARTKRPRGCPKLEDRSRLDRSRRRRGLFLEAVVIGHLAPHELKVCVRVPMKLIAHPASIRTAYARHAPPVVNQERYSEPAALRRREGA